MEYTGCDGEKYVKFDPLQWIVLYSLKETKEVRVKAWAGDMARCLLEEHYRNRPDADLICVERSGELVAASEFLKKVRDG